MRTRAANRQMQVMDHTLQTDMIHYTPPIEFDALLDDVEVDNVANVEKMALDFICN